MNSESSKDKCKDVSVETGVLSNLNEESDQAGDVSTEVSGSGRRVRNYFDVEHDSTGQLNRSKIARSNADILTEDTHRENMVQAAVMRQQQQPPQVEQLNRLECMVQSLGEAITATRSDIHESRVDNTRARNLSLRLAGLDVEPVPFLVGDRPSDLREIRNDSDVAALRTEEANAYCVGYRLSTEGLLATKKLRIKNFVNLWNVRAGPYEAEGV